MPKTEIIRQAQQAAIKAATESPNINREKPCLFRPNILFIAIAVLAFVPILTFYGYDNLQLKAQLKHINLEQFNPTTIMQPIRFSPYYIIKPEDNCPALDLVELGGIRSCQKNV